MIHHNFYRSSFLDLAFLLPEKDPKNFTKQNKKAHAKFACARYFWNSLREASFVTNPLM